MTAQTQAQRNASYRQRQRAKMERMEGALREIADLGKTNPLDFIGSAASIANKVL